MTKIEKHGAAAIVAIAVLLGLVAALAVESVLSDRRIAAGDELPALVSVLVFVAGGLAGLLVGLPLAWFEARSWARRRLAADGR